MPAGRRRSVVPRRPGGLLRTLSTALLTLFLVTGVPSGLARADPGTPGVPQPPTAVYDEDFANTRSAEPLSLSDYRGARPAGQTYTADPAWLNAGCNGSIVRGDMLGIPTAEGCAGSSWGGVRQLAWALGKLRGADDLEAFQNYALSSFTDGNPGAGVVFATEADIPLATDNRFLVFSVDAMASNCNQTHPSLLFSIVNGATATPLGDNLDPCEGSIFVNAPRITGVNGIGELTVRGATLRSTDAFLYTGKSFGLRLVNEQASGAGNDSAIDNITVVDATPQLDQSFSPGRLLVGDTATLTYTITNTGDLAAKSGWRWANSLPSGLAVAGTASTTCGATEVIAAVGGRSVAVASGDLRAGQQSCTVTVPVSSDTVGTYVSEPVDFTLRGLDAPAAASLTFISDTPTLSIEKEAGEPEDVDDNGLDVGDTITYTFSVENTGNVPVASLLVEDPLLTDTTLCATASLGPGGETSCSGTYGITQDDIDAGEVVNTAAVVGRGPDGDLVRFLSNQVTVDLEQTASLSIDKTAGDPTDANDSGRTDAGDTITYTFLVNNTGDVPIAAVVVEDTMLTDTTLCATASLEPSEETDCSGTYEITQDDVDAGEVVNVASTSGVAGGDVVSAQSKSITTAIESPATLELDKSADPPTDRNGNGLDDAGDTIDYTFAVSNTGAVTVGEVDIDDDLISTGISCADTTLAPAEDTTCRASYTISQPDVDSGSVDNSATAVGVTPGGTTVTSSTDSTTTTTDDNAELSLRQTATDPSDSDDNDQISAGDRIRYTFTVGNTGSLTITDVAIDDAVLPNPAECRTTSLQPGDTTTCTGTYRITQDDVDAGSVTNTANATGTDPGGGTVTSPEDSVETETPAGTGLTLVKRAGPPDDVNANGVTDRGDSVFYSFTVRNTGGVSLSRVAVSDRRLSGVTCADDTLDPGQSTTCLAEDDYVITQDDMDEGAVANEATAAAEQPDGDVVRSAIATETTPVRVVRAVGLVQRLVPIEDVDGSGRDDVGDRIGFGFTVVNTGTVSLTDVSVRDPLLDDSGVEVSCPSTGLAPGGTLTCTSDPYVITDDDVSAGSVVSVATATARTPSGDPLTSVASSIAVSLNESEAPTPDPTAVPPPGNNPPGSSGPPPGGSLPTQAPESLSLWIPALALLLLVPEAVLLIWRYRRNQLAAAAVAARREKPPEISVWMGR